MNNNRIYATETVIFKYFQHLKIHKFFIKKSAPQSELNDYWMVDISAILNNVDIPQYQQEIVIYYGHLLRRPKYRGRHYNAWYDAMKTISYEFVKKGIIQ